MPSFLTSGQVARRLRVSVSTLKRWLAEPDLKIAERRNCNGWRLFTDRDVESLRKYKRKLKRLGKRFNETTLVPIVTKSSDNQKPNASDTNQDAAQDQAGPQSEQAREKAAL